MVLRHDDCCCCWPFWWSNELASTGEVVVYEDRETVLSATEDEVDEAKLELPDGLSFTGYFH